MNLYQLQQTLEKQLERLSDVIDASTPIIVELDGKRYRIKAMDCLVNESKTKCIFVALCGELAPNIKIIDQKPIFVEYVAQNPNIDPSLS